MTEPALIPELKCDDYAKSLSFYQDTLGFDILYKREEEGFAMLNHEGAHLMIDSLHYSSRFVVGEMNKPYGRGINLQIQTSNVDSLYDKVSFAGWSIFHEMEEKWYRADDVELGNKQFLVQDPDGYLLRFFQDLGERPVQND